MNVTLYSFAMAVFLSTVFVLVTHLLRRREFFLRSFGIPTMLFLYGVCIFRIALPLEFPFTKEIEIQQEQEGFLHLIRQEDTLPLGDGTSVLELLLGIWIAGAVCTLAVFLIKYFRSVQKVRIFEKALPVSKTAKALLVQIQKESPKNFPMSICICPGLDIPMGVGVFKRRILLTENAYSEDELYYILKHEYTHFCNRDLIVKMLVSLFCCVFWWNPAVYLLQNDMADILELKCDMACTKGFTKGQKVGYLSILERLVEDAPEKPKRKKRRFFSKVGAAFFQQKNNLSTKERFRFITKPMKKGKLSGQAFVLGVFALLLVVSYVVVVQPKYNPSIEEVYTNSSVKETGDCVLIKHGDQYFLVPETGDMFPIKQEIAEIFIAEGLEVEE